MLEGGLKLNLNRLIRRGFADRRGVVMVLWHTTGSPTGGEHRLIALSEVDTAFDEKAVKELGRAAKLPTGADIARFGENIRIAARLYLEGKSRLNAPRLREKIERLYQLNMRAERGSDRAARALARGVEIMDDDVRRWLELVQRWPLPRDSDPGGNPFAGNAPERHQAVPSNPELWR